jgi:hypothetical protein
MQLEGERRGSNRALPFPVSRDQQTNARDQGNSATHRPSRLSGHKTPRQYIDSLQNPDASKKHRAPMMFSAIFIFSSWLPRQKLREP